MTPLPIKDAIYRELRFGPVFNGLMDGAAFRRANIKMDMRSVPSATKADADYPYVVFRRISRTELTQVSYDRERIEIEVIGLQGSATKGDELLEGMENALIDRFGGKSGRWGAFTTDGTPDPTGGLPMKGIYLTSNDGYTGELHEKSRVLVFLFAYLRA